MDSEKFHFPPDFISSDSLFPVHLAMRIESEPVMVFVCVCVPKNHFDCHSSGCHPSFKLFYMHD